MWHAVWSLLDLHDQHSPTPLPSGIDSTTDSEFSSLERDRHSASEALVTNSGDGGGGGDGDQRKVTSHHHRKKAKTRNPESSLPPPPPPPQVHWGGVTAADKWTLTLHEDVDRCKSCLIGVNSYSAVITNILLVDLRHYGAPIYLYARCFNLTAVSTRILKPYYFVANAGREFPKPLECHCVSNN